ncbi:MAG: ATP-binding protein [bacterium]
MDRDLLEAAKLEVLAENTAQAVHKTLNKLFQEEARFRARWVWELLQNARDASPEAGVSVWLTYEPHRLIFRHNGIGFTNKNIAHLIYHGSTKYDPELIGQFGTGFLTTHLISRVVSVSGRTDDGQYFRFLLDRRGDDADDLKARMDASWEDFRRSLAQTRSDGAAPFETQYEYPVTTDVAGFVVAGMTDLLINAAYLLTFNERIRSIQIDQGGSSTIIERKGQESLGDTVQVTHVEQRGADGSTTLHRVVSICNEETSVAIQVTGGDGVLSIVEPGDVPRIFVAFPLTGTRDFCLPVVINDEKLKPREERDTVFLKPSQDIPNINMDLVATACKLAADLSVLAADHGWLRAARLCRLNPWREWEWIDKDWLFGALRKEFIGPLRSASMMMNASDKRIAPRQGTIPVLGDGEMCRALWDIAVQVKGERERLPQRDEVDVWADNLTTWAFYLGEKVEGLDEALTSARLSTQVSELGDVAKVTEYLNEGSDAIEWLNQLHALLAKADQLELLNQMRLIPNQRGELKKKAELRRDPGVDDALKNIAEDLGVRIRNELMDSRILLEQLSELPVKSEQDVLLATIQQFKDRARAKAKDKSVDAAFEKIAVRLLVWLVAHDQFDRLDGLPVITRATAEDGTFGNLSRDPGSVDEKLLGPIGSWSEPIRVVTELFPKRETLSDAYWETLPNDSLWRRMEEEGYLRLSPVYTTQRRVPFIPDEPLPEADKMQKAGHVTKEAVEVSALAFFEKSGAGLDAVRRSKMRAVALLQFLADHVLEIDTNAFDVVEADCECGLRHRYYRAGWLVPMWQRRWVPLGEDKQSSATAETIAQLFDGREEQLHQFTTGNGRRLLEALKISLAALALRAVAKDEDTRISLMDSLTDIVHAVGNDTEKVRLLAEEIKQSPQLLQEIQEHRKRREQVRRNQSLGNSVERLLKDALEKRGLRVTRTGVGSDYEVSQDYVVEGNEIVLAIEGDRRSFLVEVKATTDDLAKMTVTQAQTAVNNRDAFILCMVRLDSREVTPAILRERVRFIVDIGTQLKPVWDEYILYKQAKEDACARVGAVELVVQQGQVRFAVAADAWEGGLSFDDAVERVLLEPRKKTGEEP